jgi:hypothetical protein
MDREATIVMQDYEKLGAFYLGRQWNPASGKSEEGLVLYDSKDLVTHAVCFGMTGSGKTGLCIAMMEEAAIDGVPVLARRYAGPRIVCDHFHLSTRGCHSRAEASSITKDDIDRLIRCYGCGCSLGVVTTRSRRKVIAM